MNNSQLSAPLLSVIMPVYNAEKYVYEAIDSILKQTFADFEFLIFDDSSTDSSREIILSFKDPRIRFFASDSNTGYVKHLNDGIKEARGQYIARMDADDVADPDRFAEQVYYLHQHQQAGACGCWIEFTGSKKGVLEYPVEHKDIITQLLLFGNAMAHPAVMLRKSVLIDHQLSYEAALAPAEDYELWNRLAHVSALHNLPKVLLKYRVHEHNESVVKKAQQDKAVKIIRNRLMDQQVESPSALFKAFLCDKYPTTELTILELKNLRSDVQHLLNSGNYNTLTLKTVLSNRFVAWCKASKLTGYDKLIQYLFFPKHFFSIRICLSLLLNK
ncbi:MAG: glycosyltransferase, family 2 [Cytophagaceae bacterium]|jgi:glycosyltransferase involved in cell wall biosynthesis|nr:glycosyltransferase, family 2 [Cytophagaceae bacterium]